MVWPSRRERRRLIVPNLFSFWLIVYTLDLALIWWLWVNR